MKIKSLCLTLLLSCTTAMATLTPVVQAENEPAVPQSRRGQLAVSDDVSDAKMDRMRARGAAIKRPGLQQAILGVNVKTLHGVQVMNVLPGSPAEKAGVLAGDIILEINRIPINSAEELQKMVARNPGGTPLSISLTRNDRPLTVSASLGSSVARDTAAVRKPAVAEEIDPAQTSDDPTFGYTKENPVKLGGDSLRQGVAASYVYLKQLRDKNSKPFKYSRVGNVGPGPDGHITDFYKLTDSEGTEFSVYIDAYHPESNALDCKAPKGMLIAQ